MKLMSSALRTRKRKVAAAAAILMVAGTSAAVAAEVTNAEGEVSTKIQKPFEPCRMVDTRSGLGGKTGRFAAGETHTFTLNCGDTANTNQAVFVSISAVDPSGPGFVRVWEDGLPEPTSSTVLNYGNVGITTGAFIPLDFDTGKYKVKNFGGTTHLVIDHAAWVLP